MIHGKERSLKNGNGKIGLKDAIWLLRQLAVFKSDKIPILKYQPPAPNPDSASHQTSLIGIRSRKMGMFSISYQIENSEYLASC